MQIKLEDILLLVFISSLIGNLIGHYIHHKFRIIRANKKIKEIREAIEKNAVENEELVITNFIGTKKPRDN